MFVVCLLRWTDGWVDEWMMCAQGGQHWVLLTGCRGGGVFDVNDPGNDALLLLFRLSIFGSHSSVWTAPARACGADRLSPPVLRSRALIVFSHVLACVNAGFNRNTYTMGDILQEAVYH